MVPLTTKRATSPSVIKPIAKIFVVGSNRKTNLLVQTPYSSHMCLILSSWQTIASQWKSPHNLSTHQNCQGSLVRANSNVVWIILPKHLTSKLLNPSQRSINNSRPSYLKIIVIIGWISNWGIIRIDSKKQSRTWNYMLKFHDSSP